MLNSTMAANPASFDSNDSNSWHFGALDRDAANRLLEQAHSGEFFIRASQRHPGSYVLCVKEGSKSMHYIIDGIEKDEKSVLKIGDLHFSSLPELLDFYKTHILEQTALVQPVPLSLKKKLVDTYISNYKFEGKDSDDLPLHKYEVVTVIDRPEEDWWRVVNSAGAEGMVPVNHLERYDASKHEVLLANTSQEKPDRPNQTPNTGSAQNSTRTEDSNASNPRPGSNQLSPTKFSPLSGQPHLVQRTTTTPATGLTDKQRPRISRQLSAGYQRRSRWSRQSNSPQLNVPTQRSLPAQAIAIKNRVPNFYQPDALKFDIGDRILVTKINVDGEWEGTLYNSSGEPSKSGLFPFTYVRWADDVTINSNNNSLSEPPQLSQPAPT